MKASLFSKFLANLAIVTIIANTALAGGEGWMTNMEEAKKKAVTENKDLLIEFSGSDWCPPCQYLNTNILSKPEFISAASEKFILVTIDFPKETPQPAEIRVQNEKLQAHYQIQGFPSILLTDSDGMPYAMTSVQPGGPAEYMESLNAMIPVKTQFKEAINTANKLEGTEKAAALWSALGKLEGVPISFSFLDIIRSISAADPSFGGGKIEHFLIRNEITTFEPGQDHLPLFEKIDTFIESHQLEGMNKQGMLYGKVPILLQLQDYPTLKATIAKIIAVDPQSQIGTDLAVALPEVDIMEKEYNEKKAAQ